MNFYWKMERNDSIPNRVWILIWIFHGSIGHRLDFNAHTGMRYWDLSSDRIDASGRPSVVPELARLDCPDVLTGTDTPAAAAAELAMVFGPEQSTGIVYDAVASYILRGAATKTSKTVAEWVPPYGQSPQSIDLIQTSKLEKACRAAMPPLVVIDPAMGTDGMAFSAAETRLAHTDGIIDLPYECSALNEAAGAVSVHGIALRNFVGSDGRIGASAIDSERSNNASARASSLWSWPAEAVYCSTKYDAGDAQSAVISIRTSYSNAAPLGRFAWEWMPRSALLAQQPGLVAIASAIQCNAAESAGGGKFDWLGPQLDCRLDEDWWTVWGQVAAGACASRAWGIADPSICQRLQVMHSPSKETFAAAIRLLPLSSAGRVWLAQSRSNWSQMRRFIMSRAHGLSGEAVVRQSGWVADRVARSRFRRAAEWLSRGGRAQDQLDWTMRPERASRSITALCSGRVLHADTPSLQGRPLQLRQPSELRLRPGSAESSVTVAKEIRASTLGVGMQDPERVYQPAPGRLPAVMDPAGRSSRRRALRVAARSASESGLSLQAQVQLEYMRNHREADAQQWPGDGDEPLSNFKRVAKPLHVQPRQLPGSFTTGVGVTATRNLDGLELQRGPGLDTVRVLQDAWSASRTHTMLSVAIKTGSLRIEHHWPEHTSLTGDRGMQWRPVAQARAFKTLFQYLATETMGTWSRPSRQSDSPVTGSASLYCLVSASIAAARLASQMPLRQVPSSESVATMLCPALMRGKPMPLAAQALLEQDKWVSELVWPGLQGGFFVEAGAVDGRKLSTTWALEHALGWTGLLVEARGSELPGLRVRRPNSRSVHAALGTSDGGTLSLGTSASDVTGVLAHSDVGYQRGVDNSTYVEQAPIRALGSLLDEIGAPRLIHFLTLDVEGAEVDVLKSFPFDRYTIGAASIEHSGFDQSRAAVAGILSRQGMVFVGQRAHDDLWVSQDVANTMLARLDEQQRRRRGRGRRIGFGGAA